MMTATRVVGVGVVAVVIRRTVVWVVVVVVRWCAGYHTQRSIRSAGGTRGWEQNGTAPHRHSVALLVTSSACQQGGRGRRMKNDHAHHHHHHQGDRQQCHREQQTGHRRGSAGRLMVGRGVGWRGVGWRGVGYRGVGWREVGVWRGTMETMGPQTAPQERPDGYRRLPRA
jgi:hypothetical protein